MSQMRELCLYRLSELIDMFDEGASPLLDGLRAFSCRNAAACEGDATKDANDPNLYLRSYALEDEQYLRCVTYLVLDFESLNEGRVEIIGYFTLSLGQFDSTVLPDEVRAMLLGSDASRLAGKYVPAYLIAQLACSESVSHEEFNGASLLNFAESMVKRAAAIAGGSLMYLECGDVLVPYYQNLGYVELKERGRDGLLRTMVKLIRVDDYEDDMASVFC